MKKLGNSKHTQIYKRMETHKEIHFNNRRVTRYQFSSAIIFVTWWRHQIQTFSSLLAICAVNSSVTGRLSTQRPVRRSFDVFFDMRLNKRLCKQWRGWWFETRWCPLWRHCKEMGFKQKIWNWLCFCCCWNRLTVLRLFPDTFHAVSLVLKLASILLKQNKDVNYNNIWGLRHYNDVIMSAMASQITSFTIVYLTVYSEADERKRQSSASLAFVRGIHRWPVNSPHKWPATRKTFPFDDVIMQRGYIRMIHKLYKVSH